MVCASCLIPGEALIIGDIAECLACAAGIWGTYQACDAALATCTGVDQEKADQIQGLKDEIKALEERLRKLEDKILN